MSDTCGQVLEIDRHVFIGCQLTAFHNGPHANEDTGHTWTVGA